MSEIAQGVQGLNWQAIGVIVTVITFIVGSLGGLGVRLILVNLKTHRELFEEKVLGVEQKFLAAVERNSAVDVERMGRLQDRQSKLEDRYDRLDRDFRGFLERLPSDYVHRDDYIRTFNQLDGKIDRFATKTDARLEAIYEIITEAREAIAQQKETKS